MKPLAALVNFTSPQVTVAFHLGRWWDSPLANRSMGRLVPLSSDKDLRHPGMIGSNLYGDYGGWDNSRPTTQDERGAGTGWLLQPGISRKAHGVHERA